MEQDGDRELTIRFGKLEGTDDLEKYGFSGEGKQVLSETVKEGEVNGNLDNSLNKSL